MYLNWTEYEKWEYQINYRRLCRLWLFLFDTLTPLGIASEKIKVDDVMALTHFYEVPNELQKVDIVVGRAVTEQGGVLVYKSPHLINYIMFLQLLYRA